MTLTDSEVLRILLEELDMRAVQREYPEITRARVELLIEHADLWDAARVGEPEESSEVELYVDGAFSAATEQAGIGVQMLVGGRPVCSISRNIGRATSNEAEYRAFIEGLRMAMKRKAQRVRVFTDSELLSNQINGSYRVRSAHLRPLHEEAKKLLEGFEEWRVSFIRREENKYADVLAKNAVGAPPERSHEVLQ